MLTICLLLGLKKIDTKCYRDDLPNLPKNNPTDIYGYLDAILKTYSEKMH